MALTQGDPLPSVTTTETNVTTTPDFYSNYLSGLASSGQEAVQAGGVAAFSPLQEQAFAMAPTAIQAGQPALQTATDIATGVGTTPFMQNVSQYMNPYTQSVIEEMNRLGQRQFRETLAPGVTAGAVGSGQFGSKRGMQVYGNVVRDVNQDILGKQAEYLAKGFDAATAAAKAQADLELAASGRLAELSRTGYEQGVGGLNVLSGLGAQEQAQEQAKLDYPMTALKKQADLLRGFTIPTSTTKTSTGPLPGSYYSKSDLETGLGYLTALSGAFTPDAQGRIPANEIWNALKRIPGLGDLFKSIETGLGSLGGTTPAAPDTGGGDTTGGTSGDAGVGDNSPWASDDSETGVGVDLTGGTGKPVDTGYYDDPNNFNFSNWSIIEDPNNPNDPSYTSDAEKQQYNEFMSQFG